MQSVWKILKQAGLFLVLAGVWGAICLGRTSCIGRYSEQTRRPRPEVAEDEESFSLLYKSWRQVLLIEEDLPPLIYMTGCKKKGGGTQSKQ